MFNVMFGGGESVSPRVHPCKPNRVQSRIARALDIGMGMIAHKRGACRIALQVRECQMKNLGIGFAKTARFRNNDG